MTAGLALIGCGPDVDASDVYPRNCGQEGPVDLIELEPGSTPDFGVHHEDDHYLVGVSTEAQEANAWVVDRCGRSRVRIQSGPATEVPRLGFGGGFLLSCDSKGGRMEVIDPTGVEPPRPLPHPVHGCRVVPLSGGLAAQQKGTGKVWFHPDPADPDAVPILVAERAAVIDEVWHSCSPRFDCAPPLAGSVIRVAGDELLVVLDDGPLVAFSGGSQTTRIVDAGPVRNFDVLDEGRLLVVDRDLGPTFIVERTTAERFEFCCYDDVIPISKFGPWLVKGSLGSPVLPEPPQWTVFRSHHLPSGVSRTIEGRRPWRPVAGVTAEAILVDIRSDDGEKERHVLWPATGEHRPIPLLGDEVWTDPEGEGVWSVETTESAQNLYRWRGPGEPVELLLEDILLAFPTQEGRIVYRQSRDWNVPAPLRIVLPDGEQVEIETDVLAVLNPGTVLDPWPLERDEIVYLVEDGGRLVVRRTVLP